MAISLKQTKGYRVLGGSIFALMLVTCVVVFKFLSHVALAKISQDGNGCQHTRKRARFRGATVLIIHKAVLSLAAARRHRLRSLRILP